MPWCGFFNPVCGSFLQTEGREHIGAVSLLPTRHGTDLRCMTPTHCERSGTWDLTVCPRRREEIKILDVVRVLSHTVQPHGIETWEHPPFHVLIGSSVSKKSHISFSLQPLPSLLFTDISDSVGPSSPPYYCLHQHKGQSCPSWLSATSSALFFNPFFHSLHALHQNALLLSSISCQGSMHTSGIFPVPSPALSICFEHQDLSQITLLRSFPNPSVKMSLSLSAAIHIML